MDATLACIAGEEIYRQWDAGSFKGKALGTRSTPFGQSNEIYLVEDDAPFYLLPRYGAGMRKTPAARINYRANFYALKDLGVCGVLSWAPGGAVTHDIGVGDLVVLDDVIDRTFLRERTFFEESPLGFLRQFPVFCTFLRQVACDVLQELKYIHHNTGTAAICEGPRLETPAEVRMLGSMGAQVVTHSFAPEVFLAKELELCFAGVCYVVNYAETGSRHRPFAAGELFGGLTQRSDRERLSHALSGMGEIIRKVASRSAASPRNCDCQKTMQHNRTNYKLPDDWRQWFDGRQIAPNRQIAT